MICVHLGPLNCSVNTLTFVHLKLITLPFISIFFFSQGKREPWKNLQSLELKSLQVPKSFANTDWEFLQLQVVGMQSLQNLPVPSSRAYNLHGFLPR